MTAVSVLYYVSREGDVLDGIVFRHYGSTSGLQVEAVLEKNPGLAELGPVLEGGVRIALPDLVELPPVVGVALWD